MVSSKCAGNVGRDLRDFRERSEEGASTKGSRFSSGNEDGGEQHASDPKVRSRSKKPKSFSYSIFKFVPKHNERHTRRFFYLLNRLTAHKIKLAVMSVRKQW